MPRLRILDSNRWTDTGKIRGLMTAIKDEYTLRGNKLSPLEIINVKYQMQHNFTQTITWYNYMQTDIYGPMISQRYN